MAITGSTTSAKVEVLLTEYRALRDEVCKKMDNRTAFVVSSVTVSSAVLGFGIERDSGPLLLVAPLVSVLLGILIAFHNIQIGELSEYIRKSIELPLAEVAPGAMRWHESKADHRARLRDRLLPWHLPVVLIAVAPSVVGFALALSRLRPLVLTIPLAVADLTLLVIYIVIVVRNRRAI